MKKFLAVFMSLVMLFTFAVLPVSAIDADVETEVEEEVVEEEAVEIVSLAEFIDTLILAVDLIEDTLVKVHFIVGTVMSALDKECSFCGEVHELSFGGSDDATEDAVEEEEVLGDVIDESLLVA